MNEAGTIGKANHTVFYVWHTTRVLLILACAGACKCNRMPFPPRPATIKNKTVNVKYSQNILDLATFKTISNVKKTADATRDLIGNKKF